MGILLVYDVTDEASFNNIRNWMRNIEQHASDNVNKVPLEQHAMTCPIFSEADIQAQGLYMQVAAALTCNSYVDMVFIYLQALLCPCVESG